MMDLQHQQQKNCSKLRASTSKDFGSCASISGLRMSSSFSSRRRPTPTCIPAFWVGRSILARCGASSLKTTWVICVNWLPPAGMHMGLRWARICSRSGLLPRIGFTSMEMSWRSENVHHSWPLRVVFLIVLIILRLSEGSNVSNIYIKHAVDYFYIYIYIHIQHNATQCNASH